jgi:hypothetical protein
MTGQTKSRQADRKASRWLDTTDVKQTGIQEDKKIAGQA